MRGVHGEKIVSALESDKIPECDKVRLKEALTKYDAWVKNLNCWEDEESPDDVEKLIDKLVDFLNEYKKFIDINLIYDSTEDFLYRQKGQLKLDNTVMEEFLPILVRRCVEKEFGETNIDIDSQIKIYSSAYFASSLTMPDIGGGLSIKTKDQDFSMSRKLYLQASYSDSFSSAETVKLTTHIGYVLAELKTNLDKTMFQEASATAHDVKVAVTGAKYYLLCDYLDMTPISSKTTNIDEILILRKAKRLSSNIRKSFNTYEGRQKYRTRYVDYINNNPYSKDVLKRFIYHIFSQIKDDSIIDNDVLDIGYF